MKSCRSPHITHTHKHTSECCRSQCLSVSHCLRFNYIKTDGDKPCRLHSFRYKTVALTSLTGNSVCCPWPCTKSRRIQKRFNWIFVYSLFVAFCFPFHQHIACALEEKKNQHKQCEEMHLRIWHERCCLHPWIWTHTHTQQTEESTVSSHSSISSVYKECDKNKRQANTQIPKWK